MKKTSVKIISLLMAVCLICGIGSAAVYARESMKLVLLGDSIAFGAGIRENRDEACYGRIVADTNGYSYANHSVPGHTTKNMLSEIKKENVSADIAEADIISISIGGNNFLLSNFPSLIINAVFFERYDEFDAITADFYTDFCKITEYIRELNPDALIVLQTLYNPMPSLLREEYQQGIDRLNACYRRFIDENPGNCILIDVEAAFGNNSDFIAADFIHPSAAGNVVIAQLLLEALYEQGLGEQTEPVINEPGIDSGSALIKRIKIVFMNIFNNLRAMFKK